MTTEVRLAIYDLSQGMAKQISGQFLGPNHVIDIIPHTGILVFGQEYFFGGGIQSTSPNEFRRSSGIGQPLQIISLGRTTVTRQELDVWCQRNTKFTMSTYDLLHCNCNHFSNDCALEGLKLPQGVPDWIMQIPQRFLSSPMGQMIRPMLEQMQITGPTGGGTATNGMQMQQQVSPPRPSSTTTSASTAPNPWANIVPAAPKPAPKPTPDPVAPSKESSSYSSVPTVPEKPTTSTLSKYSKPLLSNDTQTIKICIKKLTPYFNTEKHEMDEPPKTMILMEDTFPDKLVKTLESLYNNRSINNHNHNDNDNDVSASQLLTSEQVTSVIMELIDLLLDGKGTSFALLLLRLVVLCCCQPPSPKQNKDETEENLQQSKPDCLNWIIQKTISSFGDGHGDSTTSGWKTPVERSLAWCVVSNYVAAAQQTTSIKTEEDKKNAIDTPMNLSSLVDSAIGDLDPKSTPVSVRQAASAFLYNYVLLLKSSRKTIEDDEDGILVSMLCACLGENLVQDEDEETDSTTKLRRLLIAGQIIVFPSPSSQGDGGIDQDLSYCNDTVKILVQDLGLIDVLQSIVSMAPSSLQSSNNEEKDYQLIASELVYRVST